MRTKNFRDFVLWEIAREMGVDPTTDFLPDFATALGGFINSMVHRAWSAKDWPDWTFTLAFGPVNHVVPYSSDGRNDLPPIDRVFKVFQCDPSITPGDGLDIPHKLLPTGVHVGFEHGPSVWIKFQTAPPVFTTEEWAPARNYSLGGLTYSPITGECYKSKTDFNVNHDPAGISSEPVPLPSETLQQGTPDNPGLTEANQVTRLFILQSKPGPDPVDPPPAGTTWEIQVEHADGSVAGFATHAADGVESLAAILTDLATDLDTDLGAGWTVTPNTGTLTFDIEAAEAFVASHAAWWPVIGTPVSALKMQQLQAFIPAAVPSPGSSVGTPHLWRLSPGESQVFPGGQYQLSLLDGLGAEHAVTYTALQTDGRSQILAGLIAALRTAALTDSYLERVIPTLNALTPTLTLELPMEASAQAKGIPPGSAYWELEPFPADLVDIVVRGAVALALKEQGQSEKGSQEEQKVPVEAQLRAGIRGTEQYQPLTAQAGQQSRFSVK